MTPGSPHRPLSVAAVPRHYGRRHDTRDAPVLVADDRAYTWARIDEDTDRLAAVLVDAGLAPGDRVAVLLPNSAEYVPAMFGIARAGCTIVPLNSRYTSSDVLHAVNFSGARALIAGAEAQDFVASILPDVPSLDDGRIWVVGDDAPTIGRGWDPSLATAEVRDLGRDPDEDSVFWMPFTSGTTGQPKAAEVTHRALVDHWHLVNHTFAVTAADTMLIAGPFYHSLGFLFGLAALFAGGRVIIHTEFDPATVMAAIEEHRVTVTPMVPTMYTMILADDAACACDVSSMRAVISAGSPLLTGTKRRLMELFDTAGLYEFYGSTEVGIVSVLRPEDQHRKERCVGQPVLGAEVRLLDEQGDDVEPGEIGEVHKRGLLLGATYFRSPDATAAMYRDGWAATGDLARMDDEGCLYIVDRKKDMIISGGSNVFPAEIEEVLSLHPAVGEVAVIGVPDETWGEAVTAVVVVTTGHAVTEVELMAWARPRLAGHLRPRAVVFVDEMPKTGAGKILKRELRAEYWADQEGQVG